MKKINLAPRLSIILLFYMQTACVVANNLLENPLTKSFESNTHILLDFAGLEDDSFRLEHNASPVDQNINCKSSHIISESAYRELEATINSESLDKKLNNRLRHEFLEYQTSVSDGFKSLLDEGC